ncbi:Lsa36 family surface (lipo)protein [Leptospira sp. 'Mane']|uniref:Lsa36 family surface (lipo)protein n=1 Tax=Leptospira sp. 'Mane' TaxID=3387407 RepID=UPI00398B85C2
MKKQILSKAVFTLFVIFILKGNLDAKVTCSGEACTILPTTIQAQLNQVDQALQAQYTDKILSTMAESAVITNINSSMMGSGIVNRFQIGGGMSLAGQKKEDINVTYKDLNFSKLPNVGASLAPNLVFAVNLGWLLGDGPSDTDQDLKTFMHRFNLYVHGFKFNFSEGDIQKAVEAQNKNVQLGGDTTTAGFTLRFHVFDSYSDGIGIFEFSGISLGMGLHYQKQTIDVTYNDGKSQAITLGPAMGTWGGSTTFNYNSTITSVPLDVRTGFRMFYFLTFFAGAGTSLNFGSTNLSIQRSGPLTIALDAASVASSLPASVQALIPSSALGQSKSGTLGMDITGKANAPNSTSFLVTGIELNVLLTKITLEAMVSQKVQSVMIGAKIAF